MLLLALPPGLEEDKTRRPYGGLRGWNEHLAGCDVGTPVPFMTSQKGGRLFNGSE